MSYLILQRSTHQNCVWSVAYREVGRPRRRVAYHRWWPGLEYAQEYPTEKAAFDAVVEHGLVNTEPVKITPEIREAIDEAKGWVRGEAFTSTRDRKRKPFGGAPVLSKGA